MQRNLLTVESVRTMTTLELLHYLLHNFQELENQLTSIETMTEHEVNEVLNRWLNDGTLARLVSEDVIGSLNEKLDHEINLINEQLDRVIDQANQSLNTVPLIRQSVSLKEQTTYPEGVNNFAYDLICHVPLAKQYNNFQGLAVFNGYFYIGEDDRNSEATYMHKMSFAGDIIDTKQTNFGHTASISMRKANGHFYVASGGQDYQTIIWEYDFESNVVLNTINLSHLNANALVCVDNKNDQLILITCQDYNSPIQMHQVGFDGIVKKTVNLPTYGVPQGISCFEDRVYYQTGSAGNQGYLNIFDIDFNFIDRHSIYKETLPSSKGEYAHEPQGIEVGLRYGCPIIYMMWANPMRIYAYQPHEVSKFQGIEMYSTVNSNEKHGTCLMPRVIPLYMTWSKAEQTFKMTTANNTLGSIKNLFKDITVEDTFLDNIGMCKQFNIYPRIEPSAFIDMHVATTIKYSYMGYRIVGNVQYLNQCFRIGILKNNSPIMNLNDIPDGLEIFGTITVGMRISR